MRDRRLKFFANPWRLTWELARRGLCLGTDAKTHAPLYLPLDWLSTHLHIMGPPGVGKSRLLLWLFQLLACVPRATVVLINPKGELFRMARDWAIGNKQSDRLVLFDPGDPEAVISYNPLRPNGLPVATHAKAIREAIRSAWGQSSFDDTPQLARFLYLALGSARERELSLGDAVAILRPGSEVRAAILPALQDPFLREALSYFDSLRPGRQEELAASTLARLEAFVADPMIGRVLSSQAHSLDLGEVIGGHKLLLVNLELYRPLRPDDVKLLGRLLVNDILAQVFARPAGERGPVYLLLDEVQTFATTDLCSVLDLGRELGLHCILAHQHLAQLRDEDRSGYLYKSVMSCARTKVLFGGIDVEDLEVLVKEVRLDQYDPWAVKDELISLELDPIESMRDVVTRGWSLGIGAGVSSGGSRATGRTVTHGTTVSSGQAHGSAISSGQASGFHHGVNLGEVHLPSGEVVSSVNDLSGTSFSDFTGETESFSEFSGESETNAESRHESQGVQWGIQRLLNGGINGSRTTVPFYEYKKQRVVSSRTFVSKDEFFTLEVQRLKAQPKQHIFVKVPTSPGRFLRAPDVPTPQVRASVLRAGLECVYQQPAYRRTLEEIRAEEAPRALPARIPEDFFE